MVAAVSWWLVIEVLGWLALPLAWRVCARLPGRGYPQAKAIGLLLVSYVLWLGASFRLLPNDLGGILVAVAILAGLTLWLGHAGLRRDPQTGRRPLLTWLRSNLSLVVATELLFLVVFAAWSFFRAHSGDISATEKPMEFAFINGVLNSRFFPPQDPWLSGYAISYYYFGYVMVDVLMRLANVVPAVGFNLSLASWYALVLVGAFGVVYDLVRLAEARARAIGWGLLGALFTGVAGNLEGVVEAGYNARLLPLRWLQWLDIKDLLTVPPTGTWSGTGWWWWHASRVIHDKDLLGASVEVIDEFPFFSFLLGDLHPHVLGLPFVLLAVTLATNLLLAARAGAFPKLPVPAEAQERRLPAPSALLGIAAGDIARGATGFGDWLAGTRRLIDDFWQALGAAIGLGTPGILLYGVALGALAFLNTWDFPIYLALATLALGVGLARRDGLTWEVVGATVGTGVTFGVIGWLSYLPFYVGFHSQAGGLLPNLLFPTRLSQFLVMFGLFLTIAVFFLMLLTHELADEGLGRRFLALLPWPVLAPVLVVGGLLVLALVLPQGRAVIDNLLKDPAVRSRLPAASLGPLLALIVRLRLATPWTYLALAGLLAWALAILWTGVRQAENLTPPAPLRTLGRGESSSPLRFGGQRAASPWGMQGRERLGLGEGSGVRESKLGEIDALAVLMIALALLLAFSVEFVYLKDLFGTRMNTVFKFYYQAWILLALATTFGLSRLAQRATPVRLAAPVLMLTIVLAGASLVYPLLATPSKAGNFQGTATLDGMAYLSQSDPGDAAAIAWIRQHVPPTAVVLEASGSSYASDGAERISMATGNPTLLGWDFHEQQWRGNAYDLLTAGRLQALDSIYRTARPEDLPALLQKWNIQYVVIGDLERQKYGITDGALARFDRAGLQLVYNAGGVHIYER